MRESIVPIFIVIYTKMTRNVKPETCKLVVFHYPNQAFSKFVYMGSTFVFFFDAFAFMLRKSVDCRREMSLEISEIYKWIKLTSVFW